MGMQMGVFLTYAGMIIMLFLFGKIFMWPLRILIKLAANSLIGGLSILLINAVGIFIPMNIITALTVGTLGVPGAILLLIFTIII